MADIQANNAMIQIAAAIKHSALDSTPGADFSGSAQASSAGLGTPFLALFAQAMAAQGTPEGNDATSLLAALSGETGQSASAGTNVGLADLAQSQTIDLHDLALMQALVPPAMAAEQNRAPVEAVAANFSQLVTGDLSARRQNFPGRQAAFAGHQDSNPISTQSDTPAQAPSETTGPSLNGLSALPMLEQTPAKAISQLAACGPSPSSPLMIGQEALAFAAQGPAMAPAVSDRPMAVDMRASFGSPGWQQELGDKVVWMAGNQGQFSLLTLNPPNLGTVEVRLHLNGGEAGAQFFSANAEVRQALEAAMPRLREMMAGAGIALGDATVGNQPFTQRQAFPPPPQTTATLSQGNCGSDALSGARLATVPIHGARYSLLDYYA